ncbi:MAG: NAD(P)/FAD-dependent oxidoreductase [Faecalibacterium sp.]
MQQTLYLLFHIAFGGRFWYDKLDKYEDRRKAEKRNMKVLVVGGGAAGLMAAGAALEHEVTVLEHMEKPAQKILVTGKGRCNVTNDCTAEEFLPCADELPVLVAGGFPTGKTMELFESRCGAEGGARTPIVPGVGRAEEIRRALLRYATERTSSTTGQKSPAGAAGPAGRSACCAGRSRRPKRKSPARPIAA